MPSATDMSMSYAGAGANSVSAGKHPLHSSTRWVSLHIKVSNVATDVQRTMP